MAKLRHYNLVLSNSGLGQCGKPHVFGAQAAPHTRHKDCRSHAKSHRNLQK